MGKDAAWGYHSASLRRKRTQDLSCASVIYLSAQGDGFDQGRIPSLAVAQLSHSPLVAAPIMSGEIVASSYPLRSCVRLRDLMELVVG